MILLKGKFLTGLMRVFRIGGMCAWPFILLRSDLTAAEGLIVERHERIHARQQLECLLIFFYIIYMFNFIGWLLISFSWRKACQRTVFEVEAYQNQYDGLYLSVRKPFAWTRREFS